jgi:hypothetical protein
LEASFLAASLAAVSGGSEERLAFDFGSRPWLRGQHGFVTPINQLPYILIINAFIAAG